MLYQKKNDHLLLIFTRNIGLTDWHNNGSIQREVSLYNSYLKRGLFKKISFLTFNPLDIKFLNSEIRNLYFHKNIELIMMNKFFSNNFLLKFIYFVFCPLIHYTKCRKVDIVKTNQFDTFFPAFFFKFLLKKKVIYRGGYIHSEFFNHIYYRIIEKLGFNLFDRIIISSENLNALIQKKYSIKVNKITTIPNFIDIHKFKDLNKARMSNTILFVGRIDKQKNLIELIQACIDLKINLHMYGQDTGYSSIFEKFLNNNSIKYFGKKPHNELVEIYNSYNYFFLPSIIEGNPKTLIEAMACGCICLGTNVEGINNIIKDEFNGFLSLGLKKEDLKTTIKRAFQYKNKLDIKNNGIHQIKKSNSFDAYLDKEYKVLVN